MIDRDLAAEIAAAEQPKISRPSLASLRLELCFGDMHLATATGFTVVRDRRGFLVTNRHNVRGRDSNTDRCLSSKGAVPNTVKIIHNLANKPGAWIPKDETLLDEEGEPLWVEHPGFGGHVDVVALELRDLEGVELHPHDPWDESKLATLSPSSYVKHHRLSVRHGWRRSSARVGTGGDRHGAHR